MQHPQQQQQQPVHPATIAQEFMTRTALKGGEVDVYAKTFNWLNELVEGKLIAITAGDWQELIKFREEAKTAKDIPVLDVVESGSDQV